MRIVVIDGQGGGIGSSLVGKLKEAASPETVSYTHLSGCPGGCDPCRDPIRPRIPGALFLLCGFRCYLRRLVRGCAQHLGQIFSGRGIWFQRNGLLESDAAVSS